MPENFFNYFSPPKVAKVQGFASVKEVTAKTTRALTAIEKFPGMLPRALQSLTKVCHWSRKLF
jgi:hypothetical protein